MSDQQLRVHGSSSNIPRPLFLRGLRLAWRTLAVCGYAGAIWAVATTPAGLAAQGDGKSTLDGIYSAAQSERGAAIAKDSCEVCHGAKFAGADMGPGLQPTDFKANWAGRPLSELFEKINTTMPANEPGSLGPAKSADVVAYILQLNDYPAGSADMPSEMAALQQIAIAAKK